MLSYYFLQLYSLNQIIIDDKETKKSNNPDKIEVCYQTTEPYRLGLRTFILFYKLSQT